MFYSSVRNQTFEQVPNTPGQYTQRKGKLIKQKHNNKDISILQTMRIIQKPY